MKIIKNPSTALKKKSVTAWILLQLQFITGKYSEGLKMWYMDLVVVLISLQFNFRTQVCARTARRRLCEEGGELLTVKQKHFKNV